MTEELLPHQQEQLTNWSIQRDALLSEISLLTEEKNKLGKQNLALTASNTDIEMRIEESKGRMKELDNQEKLYMEIVDSKLPELETEKTRLTAEIDHLIIQVDNLEDKKESLTKDIMFLITTQEDVFNRTGILEKVVDHVTKVSSSNIKELDNAVEQLTTKVEGILALSDEKMKAHTEILNEIPKMFVELQRKTLTRQKI